MAAKTANSGKAQSGKVSSKGERTRHELMAAARRVFRKTGYHNAEIAAICREAGKATGVFYLYFKNKQHLLYTMIAECRAEAPHGWLMHSSDEDSLVSDRGDAVRSFWNWYKKFQPDLFALMQAATVDKAFLDEWREIRGHGNATLARAIARRQAEGKAPAVDPQLAASALTGMAFFCCYNWLSQKIDFGDQPLDEDAAVEALTYIINGALMERPPAVAPAKKPRKTVRRKSAG